MIDRITEWRPGESAKGRKAITLSEDFFADHFPRHPVMPGVLVVESLAQLAGLLVEQTVWEKHGKKAAAIMVVVERARFRHFVSPGETLDLDVKLLSCHVEGAKVEATARVGDQIAVEARLVFANLEPTPELYDPGLEKWRDELMREWMRGMEKTGGS
ncbi:MAG: 3-hydroxyacyl-ACP dehydratase FabZ [Deltaproteobacteria bacterium]|nr:3-hydroxyacyl-ACP dehydratase FabZ [Deltaproteobacteria bacterium]